MLTPNTYFPQTVPIIPSPAITSRSSTPCWEAPEFSFQLSQQSEDLKAFFSRVLNYLEALNFNTNEPNDTRTSCIQLKMMFEGKDWQMLQTLLDNEMITPEHQKTPRQLLDTIAITIKSKDHFLAPLRWAPLGCVPEAQQRYPHPKHLHYLPDQPMKILWPEHKGDAQKSWSCSIQCVIKSPRTGYTSKTSPS